MKIRYLIIFLVLTYTGSRSFATVEYPTLSEQLEDEARLHAQIANIIRQIGEPFSEDSKYIMDKITRTDWGEYYLHMEPWFEGDKPFCLIVNTSKNSVKKVERCPDIETESAEEESVIVK